MAEPMTPERLAEIRLYNELAITNYAAEKDTAPRAVYDRADLLAEVDRLLLKVGEYENTLNSFTTCTECAGHFDREHTAEWRAAQAEAERDRLRHALERAALSVEHDYDSSACLQRETRQKKLSPCQQSPAEWDDDCPACDAQAALSSSPTEEKG